MLMPYTDEEAYEHLQQPKWRLAETLKDVQQVVTS
jgi:hypothetical protein